MRREHGKSPEGFTPFSRDDIIRLFLTGVEGGREFWGEFEEFLRRVVGFLQWDKVMYPSFRNGGPWMNARSRMARREPPESKVHGHAERDHLRVSIS